MPLSLEAIKSNVGAAAAQFIQNGMTVGLGTGTTAAFFISHLAERCQQGLRIQAVASSEHSLQLARQKKIPLRSLDDLIHIDVTVDGADEIDPQKQMIKGGGGALVREKIVANMSRELIIIVDETKLTKQLGKRSLPVEILPFCYKATLHQLERMGYRGKCRLKEDGSLYITDNGNYIFDIHFAHLLDNPKQEHERMIHIPGVVDTGFFFNLAGRVVVGFFDGQVVVRT